MKLQIYGLFISLLFIGCVEVQEKDKQENPTNEQSVPALSYEIEALAQPQSYAVKFLGMNCQQAFTKSSSKVKLEQVTVANCQDIVTEPGVYDYEWLDQGVKKNLSVEIPEDIVIQGAVNLSDLKPIEVKNNKFYNKFLKIPGRLFLTFGSQIITNGESVLIEASSVHSDGGQISTFASQTQAAVNQNGLNGGLIYLKTPKLTGNLKVHLIGQSGGGGEKASKSFPNDFSDNLEGGNGGNTGSFWLEAEDFKNSFVAIERNYGKPGIGTDKQWCRKRYTHVPCQNITIRPKGKDGHPGLEEKSCLIVNGECTNFILN